MFITGRVLKVVVITNVAPLLIWTPRWERTVGGWFAAVYAVDAKEAGSRTAHAYKGDDVVEFVEDRPALKLLIRLEPPASEEILQIEARILVTNQFDSAVKGKPARPRRSKIPSVCESVALFMPHYDPSSATGPRGRRGLQPERDGRVRCSAWLGPQNLVHRLPLCQFIDQFIQIAYFPHRRLLNVFHSDAANYTFDQSS